MGRRPPSFSLASHTLLLFSLAQLHPILFQKENTAMGNSASYCEAAAVEAEVEEPVRVRGERREQTEGEGGAPAASQSAPARSPFSLARRPAQPTRSHGPTRPRIVPVSARTPHARPDIRLSPPLVAPCAKCTPRAARPIERRRPRRFSLLSSLTPVLLPSPSLSRPSRRRPPPRTPPRRSWYVCEDGRERERAQRGVPLFHFSLTLTLSSSSSS